LWNKITFLGKSLTKNTSWKEVPKESLIPKDFPQENTFEKKYA